MIKSDFERGHMKKAGRIGGSRIGGKGAGALAVGTMVVTALLADAPSASAVGSSACNDNTPNTKVSVTESVNFRTGPGKRYTSKGLVRKGDQNFYQYCERGDWAYGKVLKGAHKGEKGWISEHYIGWPMNPI